jgi:hypothetical protein
MLIALGLSLADGRRMVRHGQVCLVLSALLELGIRVSECARGRISALPATAEHRGSDR